MINSYQNKINKINKINGIIFEQSNKKIKKQIKKYDDFWGASILQFQKIYI